MKMKWTKRFLLNFLKKFPMLGMMLIVAYFTYNIGNTPQASALVQGIVGVIPIVAGVGVIITIFSCIPGVSIGDTWDKEKQ